VSVRVVALGSALHRDDGAALRVAEALGDEVEVIVAGRPGPGLLELLDPARPTVLLDAVRLGAAPGAVVEVPLAELPGAAIVWGAVSSHAFGAAQALRLGEALGRPLPPGRFLGIGGVRFEPGEGLSPEVEAGLPAWVRATRRAIAALRDAST
jgi:hydrogenase maturation protease